MTREFEPDVEPFDLIVIGSGPGGQRVAIAAAKLDKSVAVIEHGQMPGGASEVELTADSIPCEVGVARFRELGRGQILGAANGMVKVLASTVDLKLLAVHIFGVNATELVHIGQAVMGCGGTIKYLVDAVFNYPTFAEAYKVAALDVMNKMRMLSRFRA